MRCISCGISVVYGIEKAKRLKEGLAGSLLSRGWCAPILPWMTTIEDFPGTSVGHAAPVSVDISYDTVIENSKEPFQGRRRNCKDKVRNSWKGKDIREATRGGGYQYGGGERRVQPRKISLLRHRVWQRNTFRQEIDSISRPPEFQEKGARFKIATSGAKIWKRNFAYLLADAFHRINYYWYLPNDIIQ